MSYSSIRITKGNGGFGGPITIVPTRGKNKFIYVTSGGKPPIADKIESLSGMQSVNGFETSIQDEEVALAIIDCGGTLRCGIYPKKGIPTINIFPTGKSGPLSEYITEDIYVSAVGIEQIQKIEGESEDLSGSNPVRSEKGGKKQNTNSPDTSAGFSAGKVLSACSQAARESVQVLIRNIIPFMALMALLAAIIQAFHLDFLFEKFIDPMFSNIFGPVILGFIFSLPFFSPSLSSGSTLAQILSVLIGLEIGKGNIPPQYALPILFAINTQNACDAISTGLGIEEAETATIETGVQSVLLSRFINSIPRVLLAWLIGLVLNIFPK